jgi:soluble lytic murein transglycosylase
MKLIKRFLAIMAAVLLLAGAFLVIHLTMPGWYARWWYPLDYADTIKHYSEVNKLDPQMVAAVVYQESGFHADSLSGSGAVGLMQLMPSTAAWIAGKTGEPAPTAAELRQPKTNIRLGCWYLRYLLDRYQDSQVLALAAYNGGAQNVDQWLAAARTAGEPFNSVVDIPFKETRDYVSSIDRIKDIYGRAYGNQLHGDVP